MDLMTLLVATGALVIVGTGGMSALYPRGRLGVIGRCALIIPIGYSLIALTAFALAAAHHLTSGVFGVSLVAVAVIVWVLALWRWRSEPTDASETAPKTSLWLLLSGAFVIVAIAFLRIRISPLGNLASTTPFRYWGDGLEMAGAGRVPALSLQWGTLIAPATSKIMLNSFDAGMSFLLNAQALQAMGALTWISATGLCLSILWLGVELGLTRTAPLLVLLLCGNRVLGPHEFTLDLNFFRAEVFGRLVAFAALALAIRAVRDRRGYTEAVAAGALFGVSLTTHLVPSAVALGMLLWYAGYLAFRERARIALARSLAVTIVLAGLIGATVFLLIGGGLAFGGAGGNGHYQAVGGADPTALFTTGQSLPFERDRHWYQPPHTLLDDYLAHALGHSFEHSSLVLLGLAVLAVAVIRFCPRRLRAAAIVGLGSAVNLIVVTLAFGYIYDIYVLATFGDRRLGDYGVLPLLILGLVVVEWALSAIPRTRLADTGIALTSVLAAVVLVAFLAPGSATRSTAEASTLAYMDWIRANTPCSARLLSNRRTGGVFEVLTGRAAVTEGMGPHLRPEILDQVVRLLEETRTFFKHPRRNAGFLRRQGVDYLVVYRHKPKFIDLRTFTADLQAFPRLPFLQEVFRNRQVFIYRVQGLAGRRPVPRPPSAPGYSCLRGSIQATGFDRPGLRASL